MRISRRLILVTGLVALIIAAACSPDDSAAIQTQTQVANDAFNTRVASVRENSQATTTGQDLISALILLDATSTEQGIAAGTATLPPTVPAETTPAPSEIAALVTATSAETNPTLPVLAVTNTLAPTLSSSETQTAPNGITATPEQSIITTAIPAVTTPVPAVDTSTTLMPTIVEPTIAASSTLLAASSAAMTQGITVFAASDGGVIDHLTTDFALVGRFNSGTAGALDIDERGNLYVGNPPNILVIPEICSPPSGDALSFSSAVGADAGLADVQAIHVIGAPERLLVVDSSESAPAIVAFVPNASGALIVAFRTTNLGGKRPWDLDYDAGNDRLFVTTTDGNVLVFDSYFARGGAIPPTRIITPFDTTGAQQVTVDLRGIVYVPSSDTLILSDVGGAVEPNDGQLLLIDGASAANGNVPVRAQIRGANTLLGDPSDIAFDGSSLYVAESFNGFLMRYDNILEQSGVVDLAANSTGNAPNVRSVTVAFQNPGGSPACSVAITNVPTATPTEITQESATSPPTALDTSPPATQNALTQPSATSAPPTLAPPTATQIPPTQPPPTSSPAPATQVPPTQQAPTTLPPTPVPPTTIPPNKPPPPQPPPTVVARTHLPPQPPPTVVPPTSVPPTQPLPTAIPPTHVPPTSAPPIVDNSGPGGGGGNGGPGGGHEGLGGDDDNSGSGGGGSGSD